MSCFLPLCWCHVKDINLLCLQWDSDWHRQSKSIHQEWPPWNCDWHYFWHYHAIQDDLTQYVDLKSPVPSHGVQFTYTVPPIHLLFNVQSNEKCTKVIFTWVCMCCIWLLFHEKYHLSHLPCIVVATNKNSPPSPFHLHIQTWWDIFVWTLVAEEQLAHTIWLWPSHFLASWHFTATWSFTGAIGGRTLWYHQHILLPPWQSVCPYFSWPLVGAQELWRQNSL